LEGGFISGSSPIADLHMDVLSVHTPESFVKGSSRRQTDLPRMLASGVRLAVFSLFADPRSGNRSTWLKEIKDQIEKFKKIVTLSDGKVALIREPADVEQNLEKGILSVMLEIEGLHPVGYSLYDVELLIDEGVSVVTVCWNNSNRFATSAVDAASGEDRGLSPLGEKLVRILNERKVIIDCSHASDATFFDILDISEKPPILSHSGVRHFRNIPRNASDEVLSAIESTGSIIGMNLCPSFLSRRARKHITVQTVVEQILYLSERFSPNMLALGSDLEGIRYLPSDMKGVEDIPLIFERLSRIMSEETVSGIAFDNFFRFFASVRE